ncbi:MAG TPA: hypothetical protein VFU42_01755, partial [Candidatus Deferrimicrobiaceae bacterium]|nr:hypothetical protein [Candidatus Deferrimicrobiaceae bacterium]
MDRTSRTLLFRRLANIREGTLTIADGEHSRSFGNGADLSATVTVRDRKFYRRALLGGSVGAGASYMDG